MPRDKGKLKIQWLRKTATRNSTFRKRRATLLDKASELALLCRLDVAMVVYGPGSNKPAFYPPDLAEARAIMQRYVDLPESSKAADRLDMKGFLTQCKKKTGKKLENSKASNRALEVNLLINAIGQGRRSNLDDVPPELADSVRSVVATFRNVVKDRMNLLLSDPSEEVPPPAEAPEGAAAAAVVTASQQEPSMAQVQQDLLLAALEEELMAPLLQEPEPPLAVAPMAADALAAGEEPLAAAAGEGVYDPLALDRTDFPRNGSYLLEMADAIMDDGSGSSVQATARDVDCLLWEHDLDCFIKPKPK